MEASANLGETLPATAFDFRPKQGRVVFHEPRPTRGYTQVIHSFAADHPEFAFIRNKSRDPDTLKFNHELHLTSPTVTWQGRMLECDDCHKPDATGMYHLKITYEENCRKCHAIQFDVRNPDLLIPHGNVEEVRAFLRTLPQQYADYAARAKGFANQARNADFAREQIALLRADFGSGEELERSVFYNEKRQGPVASVGGIEGNAPAKFPGCAYCHEVTPARSGIAQVTAPVIPDRWLGRSLFDHSKHLQNIQNLPRMDCAVCHDAVHSRESADIILPSKQTCAQCHSPKGGVANNCTTCHEYHSPRKNSEQGTITGTPSKALDSAEILRMAIVSRDK
jgi:hypothetical protein